MNRTRALQFDTLEVRRCLAAGVNLSLEITVPDVTGLPALELAAAPVEPATLEFAGHDTAGISPVNSALDTSGFWDSTDGTPGFDSSGFEWFKDRIFAADDFATADAAPPGQVIIVIPATIQPSPSPGRGAEAPDNPLPERVAQRSVTPARPSSGTPATSPVSQDRIFDNAIALASREQQGTTANGQLAAAPVVVEAAPAPVEPDMVESNPPVPAHEPQNPVAADTAAGISASSAVFTRNQVPASDPATRKQAPEGDRPADQSIPVTTTDPETEESGEDLQNPAVLAATPETALAELDWPAWIATSLITPVTTDLLEVAAGSTADISGQESSGGFAALARILATVSDQTSVTGSPSSGFLLGAGLSVTAGCGVTWAVIRRHRKWQHRAVVMPPTDARCPATVINPRREHPPE